MTQPAIPSADVPQIRQLSEIRRVVEAIHHEKQRTRDICDVTSLRPRQVGYALVTARAFGLLARHEGRHRLLPLGEELLATSEGSRPEADLFMKAIRASH